jgi:hypothetical protein
MDDLALRKSDDTIWFPQLRVGLDAGKELSRAHSEPISIIYYMEAFSKRIL